jgi:phosphocarrier protein
MPTRETVTVRNSRGLHARAAAKFVKTAGQFESDVTVSKGGQTVSGLSIMGLMMLAAGPGSDIEIEADGPEAAKAMASLIELVENEFEEN